MSQMQDETPPQYWIFILTTSCRYVTLHQHLKPLRFCSRQHSGLSTDLVKCTKMGWNPELITRFCLPYIWVSFNTEQSRKNLSQRYCELRRRRLHWLYPLLVSFTYNSSRTVFPEQKFIPFHLQSWPISALWYSEIKACLPPRKALCYKYLQASFLSPNVSYRRVWLLVQQ